MKKVMGSVLYSLLQILVGACMIIGAVNNIKNGSMYVIVLAGFVFGFGFVALGSKGLLKEIKLNTKKNSL